MAKRLALLVAIVAVVVALYVSGAVDLLSNPVRVRVILLELGAWSYLLYVVTFALVEPLGVPAVFFIVPASLIWPKPIAFSLSLVAGVLAGIVGFAFARYLARDWVTQRLPDRFRRFDERLAERGFLTVVVVRLAFFMVPPAHWVLGLSKVRFRTFVAGSIVGFVPGIATVVFVGGSFAEWLGRQPPWVWGVAAAATAIALWVRNRHKRRAAARGIDSA